MKRLSALGLGALMLGCFAGRLSAADPPPPDTMTPSTVWVQADDKAKMMPAPAVTTAAPDTAAPCCLTNACEPDCNNGPRLIADFGFYFLDPRWSHNPAYTNGNVPNSAGGTTDTERDFGYGTQVAPRIELGAVSASGLGIRVGWWGFAMGSTEQFAGSAANGGDVVSASPLGIRFSAATPKVNDTFTFLGHLGMNVWDLEGVDAWVNGKTIFMLTGGIRYAHIDQGYDAFDVNPKGKLLHDVISGDSFNGVGPTVALDVRREMGNFGLYVYGDGRGSLLFGSEEQDAFNDVGDQAFNHSDAIIPVAELELGVGWERATRFGHVFAQVGAIAMGWFDLGNNSHSSNVMTATHANGNSVPDTSTLGLFGLSVSAGITY